MTKPINIVAAAVLGWMIAMPASAQSTALARVDTNQDGALSKAEAIEARRDAFARLDRNADGQLSTQEMEAARARANAMARLRDGAMVLRSQKMDSDGNGILTLDEFMTETPFFDRMDKNGDGIVSPDEIADVRDRFLQRRQ
ncbi:MAG: signal transduction protein [Pseudomonadota bacterium]